MVETNDDTKTGCYVRQVSAMNEKEHHILSVLVKRTYALGNDGKCIHAEAMLPLYEECIYYPDNDKLLQHDYDLYPLKPFTDLIIKGKARSRSAVNKFLAGVQIGRHETSIQVIGNRKAYLNTAKKIEFTAPEMVREVPLRYDHAYGGCDIVAEKKIILPDPEIIKQFPPDFDLLANSLFRYQRNPAGKGFIVQKDPVAFENLELPNLEDPSDLLTPENLLVGDENRWHEMPLPRCTDWLDLNTFPRLAYMGLLDIYKTNTRYLKEIVNKWADDGLLNTRRTPFHPRFTNGASLGLQLPYLATGEKVTLLNIHPHSSDFSFSLPADEPKIWVDGRKGKLLETRTVIHTVVIEPDENRLSIVWRGSGPALRPYHDEELKTMPFKVEWNNR
jgi:hypothetical protein